MLIVGSAGLLRSLPSLAFISPLQLTILVPILLFIGALRAFPALRRYCATLDVTWLLGAQVLRVLGASHLVTWKLGLMAGGFALPVGLANLLVSFAALALLPVVSSRRTGWVRRLRVLTLLGLSEFAMTIALAIAGMLATPSPWDPPMAALRYASINTLPISIFPTYLIPLFSILHLATLERLKAESHDGEHAPIR